MSAFSNLQQFWRVIPILLLLILSSCQNPNPTPQVEATRTTLNAEPETQAPKPVTTSDESQLSTQIPGTPSPTAVISTPKLSLTAVPSLPPSVGPALAYLKDGDIWMLDQPGSEPYPLTLAGDIIGFAWSPRGDRLAAFNGHTLCFFQRDGSVRTACLDLGLNDEQAVLERLLALSPDQRWIVLWNPDSPQDKGAIGWMIVALDTSNTMYRIEDPTDWGASLSTDNSPGGFTGMPMFLSDGRLVGTLSHQSLCEQGVCKYQLFEFNFDEHVFVPFVGGPEEEFSGGIDLALSGDGHILANFSTSNANCQAPSATIDLFNLSDKTRQTFRLEDTALVGFAMEPTAHRAVIARSAGCSDSKIKSWTQACGLSQVLEILPMQIWDPKATTRKDLVPGLSPIWSPDGKWMAFRSCLALDQDKLWQPSEISPPNLYLFNSAFDQITLIQAGALPQWQP